jgi:hypothetical protein
MCTSTRHEAWRPGRPARARAAVVAWAGALWCAFAFAVAPATPTTTDRQLAVFDCAGTVTLFALDPLAQQAQRELFDEVGPAAAAQPDGCNLGHPDIDAHGLSVDLRASPAPPGAARGQPPPERFIRWRLSWAGGVPRALSAARPAARQPSPSSLLMKALGGPQGAALRPYRVPVQGRPALASSDAGVAGAMVLAELRPAGGGPSHFATLNMDTGRVRVVAHGLLAHAPQLHLSAGGRRVLVEELAPAGGDAPAALRSGRVQQFDSASGTLLEEATLPLLLDARTQVVCLSDRGTVVLSRPGEPRMWVVQAGRVQDIEFRIGRQEMCRFL